jgi:hypothetical protein
MVKRSDSLYSPRFKGPPKSTVAPDKLLAPL